MLAQAALEQMKYSLHFKVAVLAAVLSVTSCCFPQDESTNHQDSAQTFIESLYARYGPSGNPPNLSKDNASEAFDPSLIALVKADAAAVGLGHTGFLDYDPLCNCQATDVEFPNLAIQVRLGGSDHATATVIFSDVQQKQIKIVLTLVTTKNGWRIDNVEDFSGPGPHADLRSMLNAEIKNFSDKQRVGKRPN
jgi:hypothetical protein